MHCTGHGDSVFPTFLIPGSWGLQLLHGVGPVVLVTPYPAMNEQPFLIVGGMKPGMPGREETVAVNTGP